jgi:hypothetical protein
MMTWEKEGFVVVKGAIPKEVCRLLSDQFKMFRDNLMLSDKDKFAHNDNQVVSSFAHYGFYGFEALLQGLIHDVAQEKTGLTLHPCYSYARIYYMGAEMAIHKDRPSCEISATCCIDTDGTDWPIGFVKRSGERVFLHQEPGDIVVYSGCELEHWRDAYEGKEQVQCFLHYVNADGPYTDHKFDKRQMLGMGPAR